MLIDADSEEYKKLFGHRDFTREFTSRMPPHETTVACLVDPSSCPQAISQITGANVLYSAGVEDLQWGVQHMVHALTVRLAGSVPGASTGMLSYLQGPLTQVMENVRIGNAIADVDVQALLVDAGFGAGMKALSAIGPVGKIVAAVIGFGKMVFDIIRNRGKIKAANALAREQEAWRLMPPLQQASEENDTYYVNTVVLPLMQGGSWTPLFAPRFKPTGEWVGVERNGGFAFAPGSRSSDLDAFGRPTESFKPNGGVGLIPGFDEITSVVQVALPFNDPAIKLWRTDVTRNWPIKPGHVTDVGRFFVNTGRLAAIAWAWATEQAASPNLYKIYVGEPDGPGSDHLHYQWSNYCAGALRYLTDKVGNWDTLTGPNLEYVYGSGLSCATAAWQCLPEGGTTYHPLYSRVAPGLARTEMSGWGGPKRQGCVMDPGHLDDAADGQRCLVSLYDSHIRQVLVTLRRRQIYYLKHSLVCAYVREGWDAFRDPEIRDLLRKMRGILLQHPDRHLVDLLDVPDMERFNDKDWKAQLLKAGVKPRPPLLSGVGVKGSKASGGRIEPSGESPPQVPHSGRAMPFGEPPEPGKPNRVGRGTTAPTTTSAMGSLGRALTVLGGSAAMGLGGLALHQHLYRKKM